MATQTHIQRFDTLLEAWNKIDFPKVYREDLGSASFKSIKHLIDGIELKLKRTSKVKDMLSDDTLSQFNSIITDVSNQLNAAVGYDEVQFVAQKPKIQVAISALNERLLSIWPQIVAVINDTDKSVEIDRTLDEIQKLKAKTIEDAKNVEQMKVTLTADLKSFEERYKNEIFSKAEIIKQEDNFSKDAKDFKSVSTWWFWGIIGTSSVLIVFLFVLFKNFCFELTCFENTGALDYDSVCKDCNRTVLYLEIFKAVIYRLFLISFISYLISICVKNYNANMHNYTVNKHKANSLSAALVLLEKAKTNEGNDQLMTQAANAIFTHQPTGFNGKDPENIATTLIDKVTSKVKPD